MADDLREFLTMDEDELHTELGAALLGAGRGFAARDEDRFRRQGEKWFTSRMDEIRGKLCPDPRVKVLYGDDSDRITDASAVVDALTGMAGHPVPTIVAALAVKYGLRRLCRDHT